MDKEPSVPSFMNKGKNNDIKNNTIRSTNTYDQKKATATNAKKQGSKMAAIPKAIEKVFISLGIVASVGTGIKVGIDVNNNLQQNEYNSKRVYSTNIDQINESISSYATKDSVIRNVQNIKLPKKYIEDPEAYIAANDCVSHGLTEEQIDAALNNQEELKLFYEENGSVCAAYNVDYETWKANAKNSSDDSAKNLTASYVVADEYMESHPELQTAKIVQNEDGTCSINSVTKTK